MRNLINFDCAGRPITLSHQIVSVFVGGIIAGALDLTYAIVVYSPRHPILIPQTIAAGILGNNSFRGGIETAFLGVALHFFIAICAAVPYFLVSQKVFYLVKHAGPAGLAYGALIYLIMHSIVLPLSASPRTHMPLGYQLAEFIEHLFLVGLPIALSVRHFSRVRLTG